MDEEGSEDGGAVAAEVFLVRLEGFGAGLFRGVGRRTVGEVGCVGGG